MDYQEAKTKDIIREAAIKSILTIRESAIKAMGNPYAVFNMELTPDEIITVNYITDEAYENLQQKGFLK